MDTYLDRPYASNPHGNFITPNRSHVATQTQDEDPLELLTCVIDVTEAEANYGTIHRV